MTGEKRDGDMKDLEDLEMALLLEAIFERYGYDFRHYSQASMKRRVQSILAALGFRRISELIPHVIHDEELFNRLFLALSINVTEFFRDPSFYSALRREVIPLLRTWPYIKVWHAGCATGHEVYSLAILLQEEGLYEKCLIYATDFNDVVISKAKEGIYPIEGIREYSESYLKAGGKKSFSDYYHARYDSVIMAQSLRSNIIFSKHNLTCDGVFGEMQLILCRNVLIYFDRTLQNHVLALLSESLCHQGFLGLGRKETLRFSDVSAKFTDLCRDEKIFRKTR